jgi:ribokinase
MDGTVGSKGLELENLPEIEVFAVNEEEAVDFSGLTPGNMESSFRATLAICRKIKCKNVVIKQGQRGAFVYDGKRYTAIPAYKAEKSQYLGSARYAFSAALATEYLYSGDIKNAVRYACAAGAVAKSNPGIYSSPKASEIDDLIESQQR